jgi:hypothetical protein
LAEIFRGAAERTCTIPSEKASMFSPITMNVPLPTHNYYHVTWKPQ